MTYSAAIGAAIERARHAIRSIARAGNAAEASDALQELGVLVIDEIESLTTEADAAREEFGSGTRRKSGAR